MDLLIIVEDVAKELEEKFKIETRVIAVDFTEPDSVHNKISEGIKVIFNYIDYFRITFGLDLRCDKILKVRNVCEYQLRTFKL